MVFVLDEERTISDILFPFLFLSVYSESPALSFFFSVLFTGFFWCSTLLAFPFSRFAFFLFLKPRSFSKSVREQSFLVVLLVLLLYCCCCCYCCMTTIKTRTKGVTNPRAHFIHSVNMNKKVLYTLLILQAVGKVIIRKGTEKCWKGWLPH